MSLAPSALVQLDSACDLFKKTAHLFHAEKVLVRIEFIWQMAQFLPLLRDRKTSFD